MKQLLIIAKDAGLPDTIARALTDVACALTCVSDADAALDVLHAQRVDLVFLDVQGMGQIGLEILEALRSSGNPVPVFVAPPRHEEGLAQLRAAAGRGVYHETMRTPLVPTEIRAATTAAFSA